MVRPEVAERSQEPKTLNSSQIPERESGVGLAVGLEVAGGSGHGNTLKDGVDPFPFPRLPLVEPVVPPENNCYVSGFIHVTSAT